jgi:hypothetical protein
MVNTKCLLIKAVICRDFLVIVDIPNGFAVSLKEAFSSGLSELGHLARFGLEGGINALHNMLRRRLVSRMEL